MFSDCGSGVVVSVYGFFECGKEIFQTIERLIVCTFRIPNGGTDIHDNFVLVLHFYRPYATGTAYLPKVLQPKVLNGNDAIFALIFNEQMFRVEFPRLFDNQIDKA